MFMRAFLITFSERFLFSNVENVKHWIFFFPLRLNEYLTYNGDAHEAVRCTTGIFFNFHQLRNIFMSNFYDLLHNYAVKKSVRNEFVYAFVNFCMHLLANPAAGWVLRKTQIKVWNTRKNSFPTETRQHRFYLFSFHLNIVLRSLECLFLQLKSNVVNKLRTFFQLLQSEACNIPVELAKQFHDYFLLLLRTLLKLLEIKRGSHN